MKTLLLCAAAIFTMSLSACAVHTPEGSIVIDLTLRITDTQEVLPTWTGEKGRC